MDAVILCVPTLLYANREPGLSYVLDTGKQRAPHLKKGILVVLESTTYPGTGPATIRTQEKELTAEFPRLDSPHASGTNPNRAASRS